MTNNIKLMRMVSFFSGMSFFGPVLSLYFLSKGVSLSSVIMGQTVYSLLNFVMEVPTGAVADKFGHRVSVVLGMGLNAVAYVLYLFVPSVYGLILGYICSGTGDALVSGSAEALMHGESPQGAFKKNWASAMSFANYGAVFGTLVAAAIYGKFDSRAFLPLLILGMSAKWIATAVSILVKPKSAFGGPSDANMLTIVKSAFNQIRNSTTLRNLTAVKLLTLSAQYVVYAVYAPYFRDHGVLPVVIVLVLTAGALSNGIVMQFSHKLERFMSLDKAVLVLPLVMSATFMSLGFVTHPWVLVGLLVFLQAQFDLLDPMISDYVNHESTINTRATVISGISFVRSIANMLSKFGLGLAVGGFGVAGMFRVQSAYLLAGGLLSWWLLKRCGCVYVLPKHGTAVE